MFTIHLIFIAVFIIGFTLGLFISKIRANKHLNSLKNPIGSIIAYDEHYMYVEMNDTESKDRLFSHSQDLYTFRFIDRREKNN